jgi:hypothetical protein
VMIISVVTFPALLCPTTAADAAATTTRSTDPYPIMWSAGHTINASTLQSAEIVPSSVFNWSPHDTASPQSWHCGRALVPNQTRGACILSLWPLIAGAGSPSDINGGVPQAANLSAHLEMLRRTLPQGLRSDFRGIAAMCVRACVRACVRCVLLCSD